MADWQVEFAIVPRTALDRGARIPRSNLLATNWWEGASLPSAYAKQLAAVMTSGVPSSPEVQTWGDPDGNRVDVWSEHGRATRVVAHVDVRRLDARFGAMLLQFARVANAVLIRRDGLVIEPTAGAFGAALRSSEAWQYANDPAAARFNTGDDSVEDE